MCAGALDEWGRRHLVRVEANSWSFIHGMLRESLLRHADIRVVEAHRAWAKVLADVDPKSPAIERLANHLVASGQDELAIVPLQQAAEASLGWQDTGRGLRLLDMARIAWKRSQEDTPKHHFFSGKVFQAKFFVKYILPKTETVLGICAKHGREIIDMPDRAF